MPGRIAAVWAYYFVCGGNFYIHCTYMHVVVYIGVSVYNRGRMLQRVRFYNVPVLPTYLPTNLLTYLPTYLPTMWLSVLEIYEIKIWSNIFERNSK